MSAYLRQTQLIQARTIKSNDILSITICELILCSPDP